MKEICPVCGSKTIVCVDKQSQKYRCRSCDEVFTLSESPKIIERVVEKIVEKPQGKNELTPADIYKAAIDSVFELSCEFDDSSCGGTGFYISSDGYSITNCHVVIDCKPSGKYVLCDEVYSCKSKAVDYNQLQIVYIDPKNDLALLKDDVKTVKALRLADSTPEIGERVAAIGNSKGEGLSIVDGIVSDNERDFNGHSAFLFSALVANGCSGGPVFNERGEVCGVTVGGRDDAEGMKYAIPVETLRDFIKAAETEKGINIILSGK